MPYIEKRDTLLAIYIIGVAFASIAIPLGDYFVKIDWLAGIILCLSLVSTVLLSCKSFNRLLLIYITAFILYLVLNGVVSYLVIKNEFRFQAYMSYLFQYVFALLIFLTIVSRKIDTEKLIWLMKLWVTIASLASILAVAQVLSNSLLIDDLLYIPYYGGGNILNKSISGILAATAWFSESSWLGSFLVVPLMFLMYGIFEQSKLSNSHKISILVLLVAGLLLSYSVTALISVCIGMTVLVFLLSKRGWLIFLVAVIFIMIITGMHLMLADYGVIHLQVDRVIEVVRSILAGSVGETQYGTRSSYYVRSVGMAEGLLLFMDNPFMGIGLGQSITTYNSGFITVLAEEGLFGIVFTYFPFVIAIRLLVMIRKDVCLTISEKHMVSALIVCLAADITNGLITHNLFSLQRWLLISLIISWILHKRDDAYCLISMRV